MSEQSVINNTISSETMFVTDCRGAVYRIACHHTPYCCIVVMRTRYHNGRLVCLDIHTCVKHGLIQWDDDGLMNDDW